MSVFKSYRIIILFLVIGLGSCATYYTKSKSTEEAILSYDYEVAEEKIESSKFLGKRRNALLYYLELAKICHLKGDFTKSIEYFNYADFLMDQYNSVADIAIGMAINPAMQPYRTEQHENIMVHYYNALNYLYLNNIEEAVVEARKINLRQHALEVSSKGKASKYSKDAFGLMMMGMIYESNNDYNNAFIAYRNSFEAYQSLEIDAFSKMPVSLIPSLINMSKAAGIPHQVNDSLLFHPKSTKGEGGELILFWENGLAPIKMEKNLFFTLDKDSKSGNYFFSDAQGIIHIPVDYDFDSNSSDFNPSDIGIIRLAYSYYVDRVPNASSAKVMVNEKEYSLSIGAPISKIAFQIERDNYFKELGKRLLRLSIKKLAELSVSKENEYLGLAIGIANASTEKADTRNWQSLPNEIQFARIPLSNGNNKIHIITDNGQAVDFEIKGEGDMVFKNIATF